MYLLCVQSQRISSVDNFVVIRFVIESIVVRNVCACVCVCVLEETIYQYRESKWCLLSSRFQLTDHQKAQVDNQLELGMRKCRTYTLHSMEVLSTFFELQKEQNKTKFRDIEIVCDQNEREKSKKYLCHKGQCH
jgi:hypothetical protein